MNEISAFLSNALSCKKQITLKEKRMYCKAINVLDDDTREGKPNDIIFKKNPTPGTNCGRNGKINRGPVDLDEDCKEDWVLLTSLAVGGLALFSLGLFVWLKRKK
jgi:hypothetical protein